MKIATCIRCSHALDLDIEGGTIKNKHYCDECLARLLSPDAYRAGLKEGVTRYAFWQDGVQYCGVSSMRPLSKVLAEIDSE